MSKKKISLVMDEGVVKDFRRYCRKHAYKFSAKVEILLRKELNKPIKQNHNLNSFIYPHLAHELEKRNNPEMELPKPLTNNFQNSFNDPNSQMIPIQQAQTRPVMNSNPVSTPVKIIEKALSIDNKPRRQNDPKLTNDQANIPSIDLLRRRKGL